MVVTRAKLACENLESVLNTTNNLDDISANIVSELCLNWKKLQANCPDPRLQELEKGVSQLIKKLDETSSIISHLESLVETGKSDILSLENKLLE
ncbi:hypothetical protein J6590_108062, partial [Homalodisca vitripennis]